MEIRSRVAVIVDNPKREQIMYRLPKGWAVHAKHVVERVILSHHHDDMLDRRGSGLHAECHAPQNSQTQSTSLQIDIASPAHATLRPTVDPARVGRPAAR